MSNDTSVKRQKLSFDFENILLFGQLFLIFHCIIADRSSDILLKRRLRFKHRDSQFHFITFSDFNNNFIEFLKSLRTAISCATALSSVRFTTLPVLIKVDTSKAQSKQ